VPVGRAGRTVFVAAGIRAGRYSRRPVFAPAGIRAPFPPQGTAERAECLDLAAASPWKPSHTG